MERSCETCKHEVESYYDDPCFWCYPRKERSDWSLNAAILRRQRDKLLDVLVQIRNGPKAHLVPSLIPFIDSIIRGAEEA